MKRWIIRGLFAVALLFCIGTWGWSYAYVEDIGYNNGSEYAVAFAGGKIKVFVQHHGAADCGWWRVQFPYKGGGSGGVGNAEVRLLGFRLTYASPSLDYWQAEIPFWFPTTISAILFWLVWRKTHSKAKGGAFPVELAKSEGGRNG